MLSYRLGLLLPFVALIACSSPTADGDAPSETASSSISTVTAGAWTGVYDFGAPAAPNHVGNRPTGTIRIYNEHKGRLIAFLHVETTYGSDTRILWDGPIPIVGANKAVFETMTVDEDLYPVGDPNKCRIELVRQPTGDIDVTATHCAAKPLPTTRFVRRKTAGVADSAYAATYKEMGFLDYRIGGATLEVGAVAAGATNVRFTLTSRPGAAPVSFLGSFTRAGLRANVVDSSGCKGWVDFKADAVKLNVDWSRPCNPTATGPGTWSLSEYDDQRDFGDPKAPDAWENFTPASNGGG